MVANPDPLHFSCFAPQVARPGIESRLMEPGGGEVSLDLYMLTKASAAVARARQASAPHSPAARSIPFLYFEREPSGEPRCDMNSKGGPVHVAAWRGDALVVKVWERVGASNPRWCRPISHLLILRDILALLAGFPLGWLAPDSSLLIPESQCLPPSSLEARLVMLMSPRRHFAALGPCDRKSRELRRRVRATPCCRHAFLLSLQIP